MSPPRQAAESEGLVIRRPNFTKEGGFPLAEAGGGLGFFWWRAEVPEKGGWLGFSERWHEGLGTN